MPRHHSANRKPREAMATGPSHYKKSADASNSQTMAKSINKKRKGKSKSQDSNSGSSSDERSERARRKTAQLKRKRQGNSPERPRLTVCTPERRENTFWGNLIIRDRPAAVDFAAMAYERSSLAHLVFWTDGSLRRDKAGGAGVVYTCRPGNEEAWSDRGYAIKGFDKPSSLELFGIGAALRMAAGIVTGSVRPKGSRPPDSSASSQTESGSSSSMSTTVTRIVTILTDSMKSIELLGGKRTSHDETENEMVRKVMAWSQRLVSLQADIIIEIHWVPGHDHRTPCNKRADLMAKAASRLVLEGLSQTNRDGMVISVDASFL